MDRTQKAAVIEKVAAEISESEAVIAVDYRGISVPQAAELRTKLRDSDATFTIVKNTLSERAADQAGASSLKPYLTGPTAFTFVRGDAAQAAKTLTEFQRSTQTLAFKGGFMNGTALSPDDLVSISRLPSREVLYGQLVGTIAFPIGGLARTLNAMVGGLAIALGAIRDKGGDDSAGVGALAGAAPSTSTDTNEE